MPIAAVVADANVLLAAVIGEGNRCVTDPHLDDDRFFPLPEGPHWEKDYCKAAGGGEVGPGGNACGSSMACIGGAPVNKAIWWTDPAPFAKRVLDRITRFEIKPEATGSDAKQTKAP
jgi:hypothetical protein